MDWDKYGYVMASEYRKKALMALYNEQPLTPKQISERTDYRITHISNTLSELGNKELVECLTEERSKGRLYALMAEGEEIGKKLSK